MIFLNLKEVLGIFFLEKEDINVLAGSENLGVVM